MSDHLPTQPGWHPWRKSKSETIKKPVLVCRNGDGLLCVRSFREVEVPLADYGGVWGRRINALEPDEGKR